MTSRTIRAPSIDQRLLSDRMSSSSPRTADHAAALAGVDRHGIDIARRPRRASQLGASVLARGHRRQRRGAARRRSNRRPRGARSRSSARAAACGRTRDTRARAPRTAPTAARPTWRMPITSSTPTSSADTAKNMKKKPPGVASSIAARSRPRRIQYHQIICESRILDTLNSQLPTPNFQTIPDRVLGSWTLDVGSYPRFSRKNC